MPEQQQNSVSSALENSAKYTMTISRLTVDKLGVKLYDKVSAVIAELVSNSYDADAVEVTITAPMGEFLATKRNNNLIDKGYSIEVYDNGIGMTPEEVNKFYLCVGADRRADSKRGDESRLFKRAPRKIQILLRICTRFQLFQVLRICNKAINRGAQAKGHGT